MSDHPQIDTDIDHIQRSGRDVSTIPAVLSSWLSAVMPDGITRRHRRERHRFQRNVLETIILTGRWVQDGELVTQRWVARVAPTAADVRCFRTTDWITGTTSSGSCFELNSVRCPPCGGWTRRAACWARRSS